jgi:hypothetical protein
VIGTIRKVWPGDKRVDVIVCDQADGKLKECYVFLPEGQWIAALCQTGVGNERPLVLTVEPPTYWGYKILEAELMPETRNALRIAQDAELDAAIDLIERDIRTELADDSVAGVQMDIDRARGKQWKDI